MHHFAGMDNLPNLYAAHKKIDTFYGHIDEKNGRNSAEEGSMLKK